MAKRTVEIANLLDDSFALYGTFTDMINPVGIVTFGEPPIQFMPDMAQLDLAGDNLALSVCCVNPRPLIIDTCEFHTGCGELILPLDGDVLVHVGPPTASKKVPLDDIEVFLVPKGTALCLKRGVWHHAPFAAGDSPVSIMIGLPPRTYYDDCEVVKLEGDDQIEIENERPLPA